GGMNRAPAFLLFVIVRSLAPFCKAVVLPVDDQHGMLALQRIRIVALFGGSERAAHDLAPHVVVAAGLVVVPFPLPALRLQAAILCRRDVEDRVVAEPQAGKALAVLIKTLKERDA